MKKMLIYAACATLLFSSCDSYTGSGAYAGVSLGSILGSAIGGIADGPRGSDIGTIIGMAGGVRLLTSDVQPIKSNISMNVQSETMTIR